jgi:CheY-like chemotaxis protein
VLVAVSDTGFGIFESDLAKLFTPFDRLGAETTDIEGTGIGLTLSRALSQQMGGSLTVFSEPGIGTTFTLELPESTPAEQAPPQAGEGSVTVHESTAAPRAVTVLAIEDNVANLRLLEQALRRCGNVVLLTAIQGRLGLDLATQHQPDLILLDLHLPDLPGDSVLQHLQADPATASIPVVICSADASPSQPRQMIERGAAAYLTKPYLLSELFDVIKQVRAGEPVHTPDTGMTA